MALHISSLCSPGALEAEKIKKKHKNKSASVVGREKRENHEWFMALVRDSLFRSEAPSSLSFRVLSLCIVGDPGI